MFSEALEPKGRDIEYDFEPDYRDLVCVCMHGPEAPLRLVLWNQGRLIKGRHIQHPTLGWQGSYNVHSDRCPSQSCSVYLSSGAL
jgi:hypothetical protein